MVERAVEAIRALERHRADPESSREWDGRTADAIISDYLEERGEPTAGKRWSKLIRAAARRAFGDSYGKSQPTELPSSRDLRYYDRRRPSSARLDLLDRDGAAA